MGMLIEAMVRADTSGGMQAFTERRWSRRKYRGMTASSLIPRLSNFRASGNLYLEDDSPGWLCICKTDRQSSVSAHVFSEAYCLPCRAGTGASGYCSNKVSCCRVFWRPETFCNRASVTCLLEVVKGLSDTSRGSCHPACEYHTYDLEGLPCDVAERLQAAGQASEKIVEHHSPAIDSGPSP